MRVQLILILTIAVLVNGCSSDDGNIDKHYTVLDSENRSPAANVKITLYGEIICGGTIYGGAGACGRVSYGYGFTDQNGEVVITINQDEENKVEVISAYGWKDSDNLYPFQEFSYSPRMTTLFIDPYD
ncbi:hypothetical protein [Robiginitalea sp. SC105]|uniref:hypothetical protein n=1 Tax=Robiginitalea sp. SC105 TaxID=2762332 RepID=UPI00163A0483|nr:hypothetical protein [Robiginitalea sp. SC105]MBC2840092.1 hypothetical protein [Robiginitalea sp. SC105]